MGCLGIILIGLGGLFLFYGLIVIWLPLGWILFLIPGMVLIILGLGARRKAREIRIRKQMGSRW